MEKIGIMDSRIVSSVVNKYQDGSSRDCIEYRGKFTIDELSKKLYEVYTACQDDNWDGYEAYALTYAVYNKALCLATDNIPCTSPMPDVVPEPDNGIGYEWELDDDNYLIISVNETDEIAYIAKIKGKKNIKTVGAGEIKELIANSLAEIYTN
ncbi:MAG: hypothetical protein L3V56_04290 [Candidatus Magnetoovum sp. WYHC-5]|nr:hypothetical protein [Candidatus Magnetoovum sp. WYHC-5]